MRDLPDEFDSPDDTGQPAPWIVAGFDGECSCGLDDIMEGDTIRADGVGGWMRKECVDDLRDGPSELYRGWKEDVFPSTFENYGSKDYR